MPVLPIALNEVTAALNGGNPAQLSNWCAELEAGGLLYFPQTPLPIPEADLKALLGQQQTGSKLHKNIAYKPDRDELTGIDAKIASTQAVKQVHSILRRYSASVGQFLAAFLAPYQQRWVMDYSSYRPLEEKGRNLPLRKRNDLLHIDAFPTRPTKGWRILRFFHNIHPTRTRDWILGEPFPKFVSQFTPGRIPVPHPDSSLTRAARKLAQATGLASLVPQWKRTPYDEFMMRLHNAMKENADYQRTCAKEEVHFAPGSSWMVYTETVPHAVLAGQYALEQTFLVDPNAMLKPQLAPVAVLEQIRH